MTDPALYAVIDRAVRDAAAAFARAHGLEAQGAAVIVPDEKVVAEYGDGTGPTTPWLLPAMGAIGGRS